MREDVEAADETDQEVEYVGTGQYLARSMTSSGSITTKMLLALTVVLVVIIGVSLFRLSTKEVPDPPQPPPSVAVSEGGSQDTRYNQSQKSLYQNRSTPWSNLSRSVALAFYDDNYQDRLESILPKSVSQTLRSSDWPTGTDPILTDRAKEGDTKGYTKIEFREGWSAYLLVELREGGGFDVTGLEFDRDSP